MGGSNAQYFNPAANSVEKQAVCFLLDAATASFTNTALKIAELLPRQKHEVVDNNSALLSHSVRSPMQRPAGVPPMKKHSLPRLVVVVPLSAN